MKNILTTHLITENFKSAWAVRQGVRSNEKILVREELPRLAHLRRDSNLMAALGLGSYISCFSGANFNQPLVHGRAVHHSAGDWSLLPNALRHLLDSRFSCLRFAYHRSLFFTVSAEAGRWPPFA